MEALVSQYVAEGTYVSRDEVLNGIPEQAWQDSQGDAWRGPSFPDTGDVANSHVLEGAVGQDPPSHR